jgi:hypothetical protein
MYLIPGMKILRINGYLNNSSPAKYVLPIRDKGKGKGKAVPRKKYVKTKDSNKMKAFKEVVNNLQKELDNLTKRKTNFLLNNNIRLLKKGWIRRQNSDTLSEEEQVHSKMIYDQVTQLKHVRNELNNGISLKKQELQDAHKDIRRIHLTATEDDEQSKKKYSITEQNHKGIGNVEDFEVEDDFVDSGNLSFSGTDNVSMAESVGVSVDRFKFHLQLYNRFSALNEGKMNAM